MPFPFVWLVLFWAVVTIFSDFTLLTPNAVRVLRIVLAVLMLVAIIAPYPR